jgi:hypothetical protein
MLNLTRSHEQAHRTIEQKTLKIIYSELDRQSGRYKGIINANLRKVL